MISKVKKRLRYYLQIGKCYLGWLGQVVKIIGRLEVTGTRGSSAFIYQGDNGGLYTVDGKFVPYRFFDEGVKGFLPVFDLGEETTLKPDIEVGRTYINHHNEEVTITKIIEPTPDTEDLWYYKLGFRFRDETDRPYREDGVARIHPHEETIFSRNIIGVKT